MQQRPERDGKEWTQQEKDKLLQMAKNGYSLSQMMKELKRKGGAIEHKLKLLGLYIRRDGTFGISRRVEKYGRKEPETCQVPKIKTPDIVNTNGHMEFGKTHPVMLAKIELGNRVDIRDVPNGGGRVVFLDGKLLSSPCKIDILMREVNKKFVAEGKPQNKTCKEWVV